MDVHRKALLAGKDAEVHKEALDRLKQPEVVKFLQEGRPQKPLTPSKYEPLKEDYTAQITAPMFNDKALLVEETSGEPLFNCPGPVLFLQLQKITWEEWK